MGSSPFTVEILALFLFNFCCRLNSQRWNSSLCQAVYLRLSFNTLPNTIKPLHLTDKKCKGAFDWRILMSTNKIQNFVLIVCKPYVCFRLAMCFSHSSTPTCVCLATMPGIPIFPPAQCLAILLSMCFFTDDRKRLKAEKYFCSGSEIQSGMSEKVKLEQKA